MLGGQNNTTESLQYTFCKLMNLIPFFGSHLKPQCKVYLGKFFNSLLFTRASHPDSALFASIIVHLSESSLTKEKTTSSRVFRSRPRNHFRLFLSFLFISSAVDLHKKFLRRARGRKRGSYQNLPQINSIVNRNTFQ